MRHIVSKVVTCESNIEYPLDFQLSFSFYCDLQISQVFSVPQYCEFQTTGWASLSPVFQLDSKLSPLAWSWADTLHLASSTAKLTTTALYILARVHCIALDGISLHLYLDPVHCTDVLKCMTRVQVADRGYLPQLLAWFLLFPSLPHLPHHFLRKSGFNTLPTHRVF